MEKYLKSYNKLIILSLGLGLLLSCGGGTDDEIHSPSPEPENIIPSNLTLDISTVGADNSHPFGDGTGVIKCVAKAQNAIKYEFRFGNGTVVTSATGTIEYTYTKREINSYSVYVYAYSETDDFIYTSKQIKIFVQRPSFNKLIFSEEFDEGDTPSDDIWNFEIGNNNGWGNQEAQYYTEDNATVENGNLVITARAEETNEFNYSSSRITTKDKFEFQYGRVEARAKLPEGAGTWPAIWMLGSNFEEVGWPETGEIDIMEHVGNQQDIVHGTLHYSGRSGGNADGDSVEVPGVSNEFHTYSMEWSPEEILFLVDGEVYHTYANNPDSPFNKDFFIILNVAMGGTFGGEIDPEFEESSMEIDYLRVYRE